MASSDADTLDLPLLVPCTPAPWFFFTYERDMWVLSDEPPEQNFWKKTDPATIGLQLDNRKIGVWRYKQMDLHHSRHRRENVVARVGHLHTEGRRMDVGLCISRSPGAIVGRKESAVRAVRGIERQCASTDVGVVARCHHTDKFQSSDLQAIAEMTIERQPERGSVVICDMEYDSGRWDETLMGRIAETSWVSSLFYSEDPESLSSAVTWDTTETDEICHGVRITSGSQLQPWADSTETLTDREPFRLTLLGRKPVIAAGIAGEAIPSKVGEVLRLISVLRFAKIPTDTATLSDYMEKKGRTHEAVHRTASTLRTAQDLMGENLDSVPRVWQDSNGHWVHSIPLDKLHGQHGGDTENLEKYRWYPQMSSVIAKMLEDGW